ncbi:class I SAM-dependent methyltransferase [Candidatus Curtissbacteria bacterium]|nr:class I SAM-dependent methyltransferase [Candidatus Curtissbacteria bacterium]
MFNTLPYDIYERHRKVGSQISPTDTVLDVGGSLNQLAKFTRGAKITVANLKGSQEKSDIPVEKGKLPFKNGSFTVVCAIDVLEHIRKSEREFFVKDLVRVSSQKVILSFPIGSTSHRKYEKQIAGWLKERGQDVTYLEEHISFHLPTKEEAQGFIKGQKGEISYSGNLNVNRLLFKIHMTSLEGKIGKVVYFAKLIFNFFTNPVLYAMLSEKELSKNVVRAYLVIRK